MTKALVPQGSGDLVAVDIIADFAKFLIQWAPEVNPYAKPDPSFWSEYLAAHEKMLLALYEEGALLMSGRDVTVSLMMPGFSLHNELETMVDVGLSPYDALRASTYNPAMYLDRLDEFGTVEVGKRADLVLLEANPLEDITNTRRIAGVMVPGRWYTRTDLDKMLEEIAKDNQATRMSRTATKIAFPVVVALLLVALVWFVVRRVRRHSASMC